MRRLLFMKKTLSIILIIALIMGFTSLPVSAFSQTKKTQVKTNFNVTLKFAFPGDEPKAQKEVNNAVTSKMKADGIGNIKFEYTFIPWDQYGNKLSLIAAGGEEYDLTWVHISWLPGLVSKKALAPLSDALKKYGKAITDSTPAYSLKQVAFNGKVYGIPRVMPTAEFRNFIQIRKDLRIKYNMPVIKTVAELDKYFAAIAKNENGMVPYFGDTGIGLIREYGDVFFPMGDAMQFPVYVDPADKSYKVKNFIESDIFKNVMGKMREWQKKGYIPKDINKFPDNETPLMGGKTAATWSVVLKTTERIDSFKAANPKADLENVYLHPEKPKYAFSTVDNMLSVFSTSKHVNESVAFVNWFRSNQTNYDLYSNGIKNVNYKLDGNSISYDGIAPQHSYVPINWSWNDIRFARFSKYISAQDVSALKNWHKDAIVTPLTGFTANQDPIKTEMAQINAVLGQYVPALANDSVDWNSKMEEFKKKLKDAGIDKVISEIQKQINAYKSGK